MAGVVAGAGAGFHWISLETQRGSSETKRNLERAVKKPTIATSDDRQCGSLRPLAGPTPVAAACHGAFGVLVLERRSLDWQRLESKGIGERLGAPEVRLYGTGKEIVAGDHGAYPKKFGKWRDSLNRTVVGSFGIQAGSYSV
jgi:hypothetical protein